MLRSGVSFTSLIKDELLLTGNYNPNWYSQHDMHVANLPEYDLFVNYTDNNKGIGQVTIKFKELENDDDMSAIASTVSARMQETTKVIGFRSGRKENIVHDFVAEGLIVGDTDQKLSTIDELNEPGDNLTPDFIKRQGSSIVVIEFTTNRSDNYKSMTNAGVTKFVKYKEELLKRSESLNRKGIRTNIYYIIVVVGYSKIISNYYWNEEIISELCLRYKLGLQLSREPVLMRLDILYDDEEEEVNLKQESFIERLKEFETTIKNKDSLGRLIDERWDMDVKDMAELHLSKNLLAAAVDVANQGGFEEISKRTGPVDFDWMSTGSFKHSQDFLRNADNYKRGLREDFYSSLGKDEDHRFDMKSVIPIPLWDLWPTKDSLHGKCKEPSFVSNPIFGDVREMSPLVSIWWKAFQYAEKNKHIDGEMLLDVQLNKIINEKDRVSRTEEKKNLSKIHYKRVTLKINDSEAFELAKNGIEKLHYTKTTSANLRGVLNTEESYKKKSFSLRTNTEDIKNFINYDNSKTYLGYKNSSPWIDTYTKELIELGRKSTDACELPEKTAVHEILQLWLSTTPMSNACQFISDVAQEVLVSSNQFTRRGQFVLKKLKNYDAWLLCKSIGPDNHVFFSLAVSKNEMRTPCMNVDTISPKQEDYNGWLFTEWRSMKKEKFTNQTLAESTFDIMFFCLFDIFGVDPTLILEKLYPVLLPILNKWNKNNNSGNFNHKLLLLENDLDITEFLPRDMVETLTSFMLLSLEDKQATEEICTLMRYTTGKGFAAPPMIPYPEETLKKYPTFFRSRLGVHFMNKALNLIEHINSIERFFPTLETARDDSDESTESKYITHIGLINCITGNKTNDFNVCMNCFYIGYGKNKFEKMEGNKIGALYSKMIKVDKDMNEDFIEEESKNKILNHVVRRQRKAYKGGKFYDDLDAPKTYYEDMLKKDNPKNPHGFSKLWLALLIKFQKRKLEKQWGINYKEKIAEDFKHKLANTNPVNTFSTMKASSAVNYKFHGNPKFQTMRAKLEKRTKRNNDEKLIEGQKTEEESEKKQSSMNETITSLKTTSRKLIEAMKPLIERNPDIHDLLLEAITELNNSVEHVANIKLFDKEQHGGIREISILPPNLRLLQWMIELLAKCIATLDKDDSLANPDIKSAKMMEQNKVENKLYSRKDYIMSSCNDDAQKWNQTHSVYKLVLVMAQYAPIWMIEPMKLLADYFSKKAILLDPRLIKNFEFNQDLKVEDPIIQDLYYKYKGRKQPDRKYPETKGGYIMVEGGMLQGMLNVSSTIISDLTQFFVKEVVKANLTTVLKESGGDETARNVMVMQGSDDSIMIQTASANTVQTKKKIMAVMCVNSYVKDYVQWQTGINTSNEKSCKNSSFMAEYNSSFYVNGIIMKPPIKFAIASNRFSKLTSFLERLHELYNYITQYIENGGSFFCAHQINRAVAKTWYRTLGSRLLDVSRFWLMSKLTILPDYNLGYYPLDNPLCTGLMGLNYALYNLMRGNKELINLYSREFAIKSQKKDLPGRTRYDLTSYEGKVLRNAKMLDGDLKNYKRFLSRVGINEASMDWLKKNYYLLFLDKKTEEGLKANYIFKVLSPGIAQSFEFNDKMVTIMRQSVYSVVTRYFLETPDLLLDKNETKAIRNNLISIIDDSINMAMGNTTEGDLHDDSILTLFFPHIETYENLNEELKVLDKAFFQYVNDKSQKQLVNIKVTDNEVRPFNELLSLATEMWWSSTKKKWSRTQLRILWNKYKSEIPWLRDTAEETIKESPFDSGVGLYNYLASFEVKTRIVHIIGPEVSGLASDKLRIISTNALTNLRMVAPTLDLERDPKEDHDIKLRRFFYHALLQIVDSPLLPHYKTKAVKEYLYTLNLPSDYFMRDSRKKKSLIFLKRFVMNEDIINNNKEEKEKFLLDVAESKNGIVGGYVQPQQYKTFIIEGRDKNVYWGKGVWLGQLNNDVVEIHINSHNNDPLSFVEYVVTNNNVKSKEELISNLTNWCREHNVIPSSFNPKMPNTKREYVEYKSTDGRKHKKRIELKVLCRTSNGRLNNNGFPIYSQLSGDRLQAIPTELKGDIDLEIVQNTIRLVNRVVEENKLGRFEYKYTILNYTVKSSDFMENITQTNVDIPDIPLYMKYWILNIPLPVEVLVGMESSKRRGTKMTDQEEFDKWCGGILEGIIKRREVKSDYNDTIDRIMNSKEKTEIEMIADEGLLKDVIDDVFDFGDDPFARFDNDDWKSISSKESSERSSEGLSIQGDVKIQELEEEGTSKDDTSEDIFNVKDDRLKEFLDTFAETKADRNVRFRLPEVKKINNPNMHYSRLLDNVLEISKNMGATPPIIFKIMTRKVILKGDVPFAKWFCNLFNRNFEELQVVGPEVVLGIYKMDPEAEFW